MTPYFPPRRSSELQTVAGATLNRVCGSSMQGIHMAAVSIAMGAGQAFICAGIESMTRVPMMGFNPMPNPALADRIKGAYMSMGETAENVAKKYQIPRKEQEELAVRSHRLATAARQAGKFTDEIIPIPAGQENGARHGCTPEETGEAPWR